MNKELKGCFDEKGDHRENFKKTMTEEFREACKSRSLPPKKRHNCKREEAQHGVVLGLYECLEDDSGKLRIKVSSPLKNEICADFLVSHCPFCGVAAMSEGEEFIKGLEEAGLIGCFDGTGVTSENYKTLFTEEDFRRTDVLLEKARKNLERYKQAIEFEKHKVEVLELLESNKKLLKRLENE